MNQADPTQTPLTYLISVPAARMPVLFHALSEIGITLHPTKDLVCIVESEGEANALQPAQLPRLLVSWNEAHLVGKVSLPMNEETRYLSPERAFALLNFFQNQVDWANEVRSSISTYNEVALHQLLKKYPDLRQSAP